jgi:hypothetical protein
MFESWSKQSPLNPFIMSHGHTLVPVLEIRVSLSNINRLYEHDSAVINKTEKGWKQINA